jgi:hypothetical protein
LRLRPCLLALVAFTSFAASALAADPVSGDPGGPNLDQLLKLPSSVEYSSEKKAGATRSEWRQRFHDARAAVKSAETALRKAQDQLSETAASKDDWQFTPPGLPAGANDEDSTSNFALRQEVKRQKSEVDRSKTRLRELDVEANLAGVPEDWRAPSTEARSGDESVTESKPEP